MCIVKCSFAADCTHIDTVVAHYTLHCMAVQEGLTAVAFAPTRSGCVKACTVPEYQVHSHVIPASSHICCNQNNMSHLVHNSSGLKLELECANKQDKNSFHSCSTRVGVSRQEQITNSRATATVCSGPQARSLYSQYSQEILLKAT